MERGLRPPFALTCSLVLFVLLWEVMWLLSAGTGFAHSWDTLLALGSLVQSSSFWVGLGETVALSLTGLVLGLAVALIVGVPLGLSPVSDRSSRATLNFVRSIPTVVLIPLFMSSIGSRSAMVVSLVALVAFFQLVVFVTRGVQGVSLAHREVSRLNRLTAWRSAILVWLPSATAVIVTGIRMTAARAYSVVVLAGLIAGTPGIGSRIGLARLQGDPSVMLAFALVAGLVGVAFFYGFMALERRFVLWRVVS